MQEDRTIRTLKLRDQRDEREKKPTNTHRMKQTKWLGNKTGKESTGTWNNQSGKPGVFRLLSEGIVWVWEIRDQTSWRQVIRPKALIRPKAQGQARSPLCPNSFWSLCRWSSCYNQSKKNDSILVNLYSDCICQWSSVCEESWAILPMHNAVGVMNGLMANFLFEGQFETIWFQELSGAARGLGPCWGWRWVWP